MEKELYIQPGNVHDKIVEEINTIFTRIDFEVKNILKERGVSQNDVKLIWTIEGNIQIKYKDNIFPDTIVRVSGYTQQIRQLQNYGSMFFNENHILISESNVTK